MSEPHGERRFIADRMLGTLTRYLRFMGYDTLSANDREPGDPREDTILLGIARNDHRILLTRDADLARRGGDDAILVRPGEVMDQLQQLIDRGMVERRVTMSRCSLCNSCLREATTCEIGRTDYAPRDWRNLSFYWCDTCRKLYWNGSHGKRLEERVDRELRE